MLIASLFVVGALSSATPAKAAEACADPHCPWSPVTMFVKDTLYWVDYNCHRLLDNCPL